MIFHDDKDDMVEILSGWLGVHRWNSHPDKNSSKE